MDGSVGTAAASSRIGLAGLVVGLAGFGLVFALRLGPHGKELVDARERLVKVEADLAAAPPLVDPAPLQAEIDGLERDKTRAAAQVAERAARVASPSALAELEVDLIDLARTSGLRLEAQEAIAPPAPARGAAPTGPARLRQWTLTGTYSGLWTFLERLGELPSRVSVLDLHLDEQRVAAAGGGARGARGRRGAVLTIHMRLEL